jgi:hypothetical protein
LRASSQISFSQIPLPFQGFNLFNGKNSENREQKKNSFLYCRGESNVSHAFATVLGGIPLLCRNIRHVSQALDCHFVKKFGNSVENALSLRHQNKKREN